jgi:hypothetical protein
MLRIESRLRLPIFASAAVLFLIAAALWTITQDPGLLQRNIPKIVSIE